MAMSALTRAALCSRTMDPELAIMRYAPITDRWVELARLTPEAAQGYLERVRLQARRLESLTDDPELPALFDDLADEIEVRLDGFARTCAAPNCEGYCVASSDVCWEHGAQDDEPESLAS